MVTMAAKCHQTAGRSRKDPSRLYFEHSMLRGIPLRSLGSVRKMLPKACDLQAQTHGAHTGRDRLCGPSMVVLVLVLARCGWVATGYGCGSAEGSHRLKRQVSIAWILQRCAAQVARHAARYFHAYCLDGL